MHTKLISHFFAKPVLVFMVFFVACTTVYSLGLLRVNSILWGDTRYYYAYTRSLVMDRDLQFENEAYRPEVGFPHLPQVSEVTGRVTNKFSPRAPLLWIPAFLMGQLLSYLLMITGLPAITDGYGWWTQYLTAIGTVAFSVGGLYLIFLVIKERFSTVIAWWTTAFVVLATQMLYYTAVDPLNSHSASFLLSAALLWGTNKYLGGRTSLSWITFLGALGGVLSLIRNQDAVLLIPLGILLLVQPGTVWQRALRSLSLGLSWLAVISIQGLTTLYLYGQLNSPYLIQGEQISWLRPDFWRVLFTLENGILFFAPGLVLCLEGLRVALRQRKTLASLAVGVFLLQLYVVAAWSPEIIGGPYGSRMFISTLPWLAVGLGYLLQSKSVKNIPKWIYLGILGVLLLNNLLQTLYMLARF